MIDDNSGLAASAWAGEEGFDNIVAPYSKLARDRGNTIAVIEPAELARWEKAAADVDEIWLKDAAAKGHDGKKLIEEAEALLKKVRAAGQVKACAGRSRRQSRGFFQFILADSALLVSTRSYQ